MRLEQLEYLAAVVQHGSLRRASEHLHISLPALGEGVGKLERELGVVLLDRRRAGAQISPAGRELLRHLTDVLDAADRLRAAARDQSGSLTLLPDFSVVDDPLERAGLLAVRPLVGSGATVSLTLLQRRPRALPDSVRELQECFLQAAAAFRDRGTFVPPAAARSGS